MTAIRNTDDLIDSRDVIARIEELAAELDGATLNEETSTWKLDGVDMNEQREELDKLEALAAQGEDYAPDWSHGETMIHDGYFQDYAEQLADDIGAINSEATWPNNCIDWGRAARELKMDYTQIDFDGAVYWVR